MPLLSQLDHMIRAIAEVIDDDSDFQTPVNLPPLKAVNRI
jgi:hypothetical protein